MFKRISHKKYNVPSYPELTFFIVFVTFINALVLLYSINVTFTYVEPTDKLTLSLIGKENTYVSLYNNYEEEGIKITLNNEELDKDSFSYEVKSDLDTNMIGEYIINYYITYDNKSYELKRYVNVIDDIEPELVILTSKVSSNGKNNNLTYYAYDNYDGVLTDKVIVSENENEYSLSVSDSSGNENIKTVSKSSDLNNYVLKLNGTFIQYVLLNTPYNDLGVTVSDLNNKVINIPYKTESNVDTSKEGIYEVKYSIDGVDSYQIRKVVVFSNYNGNIYENNQEKVIYLTFDDGPGIYTETLLDILKKYDVKATFFVTAQFKNYVPLIKREKEEGHAIALHTTTHNWNIYRSFENYYKDFQTMNDLIYEYTGERTKIFRFPGGSSNTISRGKSLGIMSYNVSKMQQLGYSYYDWNVDSEDAAGANKSKIVKNVINGISNRNYSIVLMHDIKKPTIDAIEEIIIYAKNNGYTFDVLSTDTATVHHHVNN